MADVIQIRRDTAANWLSVDPILAQGEFAWEVDTNIIKIGDGATAYSSLPVFSGAIDFEDSGSQIVSSSTVDFTGSGVAVTDVGGKATVDIPGTAPAPVDSVFGRIGAVVSQSGDYSSAQVSYDDSAAPISATDVQDAIDSIAPRVAVFQARNTDTTTDLNNTGLAFIPMMGVVDQAGPAGYFTVANSNQVTCNLAMRIKVSWSVAMESTSNRVSVIVDSAIDTSTQPVRGYQGYIRNNGGHNESSVSAFNILDVAAGEDISLVSQRGAAAGTVTMIGGESVIIIEVLELL